MEIMHLASGSPRRTGLLAQMGIPFRTFPQNIDETFLSSRPAREAVRLAGEKVEAMRNQLQNPEIWGMGADTFVVRGGSLMGISRLLGKPSSREEAEKMLLKLSGKVQTVVTGLAVCTPRGNLITAVCETRVRFETLSRKEIEWYLSTDEWKGAAGGYRIQDKGGCLVREIRGSYSNVMGLPIHLLYGILLRNQYPFG